MSLGDVIRFKGGSYEVRALVDERYVVRIRNHNTGLETYKVWTPEERAQFDRHQNRISDVEDRACQIYERRRAGETYASLGREYGISSERVGQIFVRQARKERVAKR